jgi:CheY-like chemotaxis protein
MKIVVVEDDKMLAEIYQISLQNEGYLVVLAHDGPSALTVIQNEMPDLILLDLMLPQMSGDEVLQHIRESEWGKDLKVIITTNISESEAPDGLSKYGFERYLVKANTAPSELVQIVSQTLISKAA